MGPGRDPCSPALSGHYDLDYRYREREREKEREREIEKYKPTISRKITKKDTKNSSYEKSSHFLYIFQKITKTTFKMSSDIQKNTTNLINALQITVYNTQYNKIAKTNFKQIQYFRNKYITFFNCLFCSISFFHNS